jgi:hypothetical protein
MNRYRIRFNQTRGNPGRGSVDHVWRVFENEQEYIVKNIRINVPSYGEQEEGNWNIVCYGYKVIDTETSTIIINAT